MTLEASEGAIKWIVDKCSAAKMGARSLIRIFDGDVNVRLSKIIIEGKSKKCKIIIKEGKIGIIED